jgi:hypothetical protein
MKPTTFIWLAVLLVVAALAFFMLSSNPIPGYEDMTRYQPFWWTGDHYSGRITGLAPDKFIIVTRDAGDMKTFEIRDNTKIFLDGSSGLAIGTAVKVSYKDTKQVQIAKAIWEIKSAGMPAPTPLPPAPKTAPKTEKQAPIPSPGEN